MIANNIRRGEWQDVTRNFEFSAWFQQQNPANDPRNCIRNFCVAMEIQLGFLADEDCLRRALNIVMRDDDPVVMRYRHLEPR